MDVLSGLVLEDGSLWAESAADFQVADALAILDDRAELRQHWLTRPRGARKTTDLAGVVIAVLIEQAPPEARIYIGASDGEQAAELVDAASGLIARTGLGGALETTGLTISNRATGARCTALTADASAMGKRAYMIVLDEVANWPDTRGARRFWGVLTSGARKLADCRLVVITNAGVPEHWAFHRRETAAKSPHWRLSETPGPLPWLTAADVAILRENAETASEFRRLILNEWVAGEDALAAREDVEACAVLPGPLPPRRGVRYVLGLDLATVRDNAVAVVAHEDVDRGQLVVDRLRVWTPGRGSPISLVEVEAWVRATAREYTARVNYDPAEARGMAERLASQSVRVSQFNFTTASVGKLGVLLHGLIRDRKVDLPRDEALIDELAHVRLRRTGPGQYRLDHDSGRHDDRAVALALALLPLVEAPRGGPARSVSVAGLQLPPSIAGGGMPPGIGRDLAAELSRGFGQQSPGRGGRFIR